MSQTVAIILAAGEGTRLKKDIPKAYVKLAGQELLMHSLRFFLSCPYIHAVLPIIGKGHDEYYYTLPLEEYRSNKLLPAVYGGDTRQESVYQALISLQDQSITTDIVCIHDCARPILDHHVMQDMLKALETHDAVTPYKPVYDSVMHIDNDIAVKPTYIDRTNLYSIQTPQCFRYNKILSAHLKLRDEFHNFTDDISIALHNNLNISYYNASHVNTTKVTDINTLRRLENDMHNTSLQMCTGFGYDTHCLAVDYNKNAYIKLGNVSIYCGYNIISHSDGDVLIHALCDALYGAMGEGDIGKFFPPTDPQWKNTDSSVFLEHAVSCLNKQKARIVNIDCTIIAEYPKILPYHDAIKQRLSDLMNIQDKQINIKATTNEKMGYIGRQEGIAVMVVANVLRPLHHIM